MVNQWAPEHRAELLATFDMPPWLDHQQATQPDWQTWLTDRSQAYRSGLSLAQRWRPPQSHWDEQFLSGTLSPSGWLKRQSYEPAPLEPPDELDLTGLKAYYNQTVSPTRLETVIQLADEVPLVLVNMPVHPSFLYFYDGEADGYNQMMVSLNETAGQNDIPFWRTGSLDLIPDEGWYHRNYLNATGAQIFSRWLGAEVGRAVQDGRLEISPGPDQAEQP
jgi:hypothetical protein